MAREEDRKKFIELAEKRVNRAIKDIKLIGNLANRSNYSYEKADADKICRALKKSLEDMKNRFDDNQSDSDDVFRL